MISGLQSNEYEDKLKELNLQTLEERRIRYDMIQVYKLMHNFDDIEGSSSSKLQEKNQSGLPDNLLMH